MGIRFRRSLRLAPGVHLNLSKSGMSLSAGPRGAKVSVGSRGVYGNVGLPGTGIYARQRISSGGGSRTRSVPTAVEGSVKIALKEDGSVAFLDSSDQPLPPRYRKAVIQQMGESLAQWLQEQCDLWNEGIDQILHLHLETPSPCRPPSFEPEPFPVPEPGPPTTETHGILGKFSSKRRASVAKRNAERQRQFEEARTAWLAQKAQHEVEQAERRQIFEDAQKGDASRMEKILERRFSSISWPRETQVSFEVVPNGTCVYLDVDLPEIEDLPDQEARIAKSGLKILVKDRSETQRRKEYMQHVHAIGFRLAGEVFHLLPTVDLVVLSGYSQRPDKTTGQIRDDYLYSVRIDRSKWEVVNFDQLQAVDVLECLGAMEIQREMTKTGVFKPIEPYAPHPSP